MSSAAMTSTGEDAGGDALWRRHLGALAGCAALLLLLLHRDAAHLVTLWWTSSTFSHCLLIPPILGWYVWQRAADLRTLTPRAWWPGLAWMAGGAFVWLVGDAASVALLRQLALVLMLQGLVPALLGPQVARGLAFPLCYALLLVPMGEELVPPMQGLTADMAMALLRLSGIPAHIDGIFITTPGGHFAVAEACSGVKFLVAMAAMAILAANLCFTSWRRRALFLFVALLAPVLANGLRAFGTIWLAEHWGLDFAAGADHVIYGWVFFALVIAGVGWAASPWFDRQPDDPMVDAAALSRLMPGRGGGAPLALVAPALMLIAALPLALAIVSERSAAPLSPPAVPQIAGWPLLPDDSASDDDWRAHFADADQRRDLRYTDGAGHVVQLTIAGYARQGEGREIVGYGQGAVAPEGDWKWGQALAPIGAARVERIEADERVRDVATVYVIAGRVTASGSQVKFETLKARLTGGDQAAWAILISASPRGERSGREQIATFLSDAGGVDALARRLTATR